MGCSGASAISGCGDGEGGDGRTSLNSSSLSCSSSFSSSSFCCFCSSSVAGVARTRCSLQDGGDDENDERVCVASTDPLQPGEWWPVGVSPSSLSPSSSFSPLSAASRCNGSCWFCCSSCGVECWLPKNLRR